MNEFRSKRVTVMGLGQFGGGAGVTRWLASHGAHVLVTDLRPSEQLSDSIDSIRDLIQDGSASLRLGSHDQRDFESCDLVVANPAVPKPWEHPCIRAALAAQIAVTTEIGLVVQRIDRQRVIGITGSAGKSTTAAMIHHLCQRAAPPGVRSHLGGNIGGSLLNALDRIEHRDWIVLEFSSAMLYWLGENSIASPRATWSPHIAVITNITPNHIDWHGSFEHYRESKLNICRFQRAGDVIVRSDELPSNSTPIALKIPGQHNQRNAHTAIAAVAHAMGCAHQQLIPMLADFTGLPHRLQMVAEHDGLCFYNDSKSTTPQATLLAVDAFEDPARVHLIAGGYDKGSDLRPIADLTGEIAGLYTIGATGSKLAQCASASRGGFSMYAETLDRAIDAAINRMNRGDILLLSPGCASWDQFINYEQRGETFVKAISNALELAPTIRA